MEAAGVEREEPAASARDDQLSSTETVAPVVIVANPREHVSYHERVTALVTAVLDGDRGKARRLALELRQLGLYAGKRTG